MTSDEAVRLRALAIAGVLLLLALPIFPVGPSMASNAYTSPPPNPLSADLTESHFSSVATTPHERQVSAVPSPAATPPWFPAGRCVALWPASIGQAGVPGGCHGHDQPSMSFYSDLPGSGGNVTWSFTLPQDGGASATQSDLYAAAWFGLPLAAPGAWLDQCFLEVQFFPDSSWYSGAPTANLWTATVVGWQIDRASGLESTCFASPLFAGGSPGPAYLNLSGGDSVTLQLTGWPGSPWGENVSVSDATTGNSSAVSVVNQTNGAPLDPAVSASDVAGAVEWNSAGGYPASMGFEIGRDASAPRNNSFGGCNPGPPPPTPANPFVPCSSYDPSAWVNDTLSPWEIQVPTFSSPAGASTPSEVAFASNLGAVSQLTVASNKSCVSRVGSAYCSYPWFSFSCLSSAFEFGATNFVGVSNDFGKYLEYNATAVLNVPGLPVFPAQTFAVPNCGGSSNNVRLGVAGTGTGTVELLNQNLSTGTSVLHLSGGRYSIIAQPTNGSGFSRWVTTGGVAAVALNDPITTIVVTGNGSVAASFGTAAAPSEAWFNSTGASGSTAVTAGTVFLNGTPVPVVASGGSLLLNPGEYVLQAYPPAGYRFEGWTLQGPGRLTTPESSVTVLDVRASGGTIALSASYAATSTSATVAYGGAGNGTVLLNGVAAPYDAATISSSGQSTLSEGSYSVVAEPALGWTFEGWLAAPSAIQTESASASNVTLDGAAASVQARFAALVVATVNATSSGAISFALQPPVGNGTAVPLLPGIYPLNAVPFAGFRFQSWRVDNPTHLWVLHPNLASTRLQVNGTGSVTVSYVAAPTENLTIVTSPAAGGTVQFNFLTNYSGTHTNSSVTNGTYAITQTPAFGWRFTGFNLTGPISLNGLELTVSGPGGVLTANYVTKPYPVTFALPPANEVRSFLAGAPINNGETLNLLIGNYNLTALPAPNVTFSGWASTFALSRTNANGTNATLKVNQAGFVTGLATPFVLQSFSVSTPVIDRNATVTYTTVALGAGPFHYSYQGLPPGCPGRNAPIVRCAPQTLGNYASRVTVTAPNGGRITSAWVSLTVVAPLKLGAYSVTPSVVDVGQQVTISSAFSGGAAPVILAYSGLPTGCTSQNSVNWLCAPKAPGAFNITVTATDAAGVNVSLSRPLLVNGALTVVSFSPSKAQITLGRPVTFSTVVSGGTPALGFSYRASIPGCALATTKQFTCTPTSMGTFAISVIVIDSVGERTTGSTSLLVNPVPSFASFTATPTVVPLGGTITFSASVSGGTTPYGFSYRGLPPGCTGTNGSALTCVPSALGAYGVTVEVTDTDGVTANATVQVTVTSAPTSNNGTGAPPPWLFALLVGEAVTAAALVALALLGRRGRKPAPVVAVRPGPTRPT